MSLNASLIPVKKITSSQARSTFPSEVIEQAAKAILEAEGTINPLVVRQISFQEFQVIDGHLEYYAAVRAKEFDLARGEMIDAIVVQPEKEAAVLEQIRLLRANKETEATSRSTSTSDSSAIENRLNNLEKQIENQLGELNRRLVELNQQEPLRQRSLHQQMTELIHATVSNVIKDQLSEMVQEVVKELKPKKPPVVPVENLEEKVRAEGYEALNVRDLKALAKGRGLKGYSDHKRAQLIDFIKQAASKI